MTNENSKAFLEDQLEKVTIEEANQLLDTHFYHEFTLNEESFVTQSKLYEDATIFSEKRCVGIEIVLVDKNGKKAEEVIGYLYHEDGKRHLLVQYTENKTFKSEKPVRGLIRHFVKELLQSRKIDVWLSSVELNEKSIAMYEALKNDNKVTVSFDRGNDFRNVEKPSYKVELLSQPQKPQ